MVLFVLAGLTKTPLAEVSRGVVFATALIAALFLMMLVLGVAAAMFVYAG